jgi:hypothetical protein
LHGKAALSAEMALRIEKAFGVDMEMLLRMQAWYDTNTMRRRAGEIDVRPIGRRPTRRADGPRFAKSKTFRTRRADAAVRSLWEMPGFQNAPYASASKERFGQKLGLGDF